MRAPYAPPNRRWPMILNALVERLKRRSKGDFKGRHFEASLILQAVSWYLRYPLSYRDIEELFLERGLEVDHLYGVISVKALVRVVLSRCLFEGRPSPRLDPGNAEAIGSAVRRLSQVVVGTESIPRGARQLAQPIALAYLYSVGHGRPEP